MTQDLEAEIAATRAHLGQTIDVLADRAKRKSRYGAAALVLAAGGILATVVWRRL